MDIGFREILLILLIILILFGAKRIPEMMRAMGQGVKEFKKASKELSAEDDTSQTKELPNSKGDTPKTS